jgi:diguanylate cyclase (GGDEF)-like protein
LFLLFGNINQDLASSLLIFIIPIIFWAAIRLKIHGLVAVNFFASVLAFWGIANHKGIFTSADVLPNLSLLFSLSTMWITSLILCSSITNYQKAQKSLSDLSNHDALTHLYNRLFFDTELKRLENSRQFPITIIMADVDKLKDINDYFGHHIGDQVLIKVADIFALVFRQEDIVSRLGGDEFIMLLPNTGEQEAKIIIDRMNRQLETYNTECPDLPIHISIGVSTARKGESLQDQLKIADNRMYEEKERKKEGERIPFFIPTKKSTSN